MVEYIRREDAEKTASKYGCDNGSALGVHSGLADCIAYEIAKLPAADVAPVRHGRWEWFEEWSQSTSDHSAECDDYGWRCSECKTALADIVSGYWDDLDEEPMLNYCPKCGAKNKLGD